MKGFEMSPDCMLDKSVEAIANELMKGSFIIGCDYRDKQLILQNVFHYTERQRRVEVYTLFPDKNSTKRQLKLETAFVYTNKSNMLQNIMDILKIGLNEYDMFVIDKYNNLYTETVYDKYGGCMRLA